MATSQSRVGVTADLRMHVPRNDRGTLVDAARTVVARVDSVRRVHDVHVTSVTPELNAVSIDASVELTLAIDPVGPRPDAVADALRDGVGVHRVDVHDVGPPD